MTKTVVGIDYSMSCPSICIHVGDSWSLNNCTFHFLSNKKKHLIKTKMFSSDYHKDHLSQQERFDNISNWALSCIPKNSSVFLEGYSFSSKGVVFDIAENTGLLKHKLYSSKIITGIFPPSRIKKFASTKGNANKILMYESFLAETGIRLEQTFDCKIGDSPISDIIDSYYVCKLGYSDIISSKMD